MRLKCVSTSPQLVQAWADASRSQPPCCDMCGAAFSDLLRLLTIFLGFPFARPRVAYSRLQTSTLCTPPASWHGGSKAFFLVCGVSIEIHMLLPLGAKHDKNKHNQRLKYCRSSGQPLDQRVCILHLSVFECLGARGGSTYNDLGGMPIVD